MMVERIESNGLESPSDILVADGLRKAYGPRRALQGLSFSLKAGRILGFLGPNGAGKTTSIRILTTMLEPDSGHFVVDGISSEAPARIRRKIGVLPENLGFPRQMTGIEYLTYFGRLYGRTAAEAKERAGHLIADVGLKARARSLIGSYSHGMRQRIGIARALVNDPVVVFLDEPTLGLDPRGQKELLSLIQGIARDRKAGVVLCSHALSEIEDVCDDVVILNRGQVVAQGSVSEVIDRVQQGMFLGSAMRVQVPAVSFAKAQHVLKTVPEVRNVAPIGEMEGWLRMERVDSDQGDASRAYQINNHVLGALLRAEIPILSFEVEGGRLHDAFLHLTEETSR